MNVENEKAGWEGDVAIDPDALDVEWVRQAALFGKYSKLQAIARDKADRLKERLDVFDAEFGLKIRQAPHIYGLDKVTEGSVQATILTATKHQELAAQLADARFELDVISGAVRALDHKKAALENLVRLQGQNYFAGPSAPRDLSAEWVKTLERDTARGKVKSAMGAGKKKGG